MSDSPLITLFGVALVAIGFIIIYALPMRRGQNEEGKTPLHEERCSGQKIVGYGFVFGGNIPNWRVSFYEKCFVIASIRQTQIPYTEVQSVEYARRLISKGIRIRTGEPQLDVIFFPKELSKVMALFREKSPNARITDSEK